MEPKIEKLIEAYSQMPYSFSICKEMNVIHEHGWKCLKSIEKGRNYNGDPVYVGINYEGQKIFEILTNSVNVFYQETIIK